MKKAFPLMLTLVAAVLLSSAVAQSNKLNFFTWPEYIDPDIITQFEEEFDAEVVVDLFDSNEEALGKLQAGSLGLYDIAVISNYVVPVFAEQGMLQELNHDMLPNLSNLYDQFLDPGFDPGNQYTAAYQWGTTALAYRADLVDEAPTSWDVLYDSDSDATFALLDDMRPALGSALLYLGYDYNSEDVAELREAREIIVDAKNRSLGFYGSVKATEFLISGEAQYAMVYTGDALQALDENENIGYIVPSEGAEIWVDSMTVLADAPNPDLAHKFINYILDAEIGAQLTNWVYYPSPNEASEPMILDEIKEDEAIYPSEEARATLVYTLDVENLQLLDLVWTQIKSR